MIDTLAMSDRGIGSFGPLAMAYAARLSEAEVDAINRPGWRFTGWQTVRLDAVDGRRLTGPRLRAAANLVGQWLESLTDAEVRSVLDTYEVPRAVA